MSHFVVVVSFLEKTLIVKSYKMTIVSDTTNVKEDLKGR